MWKFYEWVYAKFSQVNSHRVNSHRESFHPLKYRPRWISPSNFPPGKSPSSDAPQQSPYSLTYECDVIVLCVQKLACDSSLTNYKGFTDIINHLSSYFLNLGTAVFKEYSLWLFPKDAAFLYINLQTSKLQLSSNDSERCCSYSQTT